MTDDRRVSFTELYKGAHKFLFANLGTFAVVCVLPLILTVALSFLSVLSRTQVGAETFSRFYAMALQEPDWQARLQLFTDALATRAMLLSALVLVPVVVLSVSWQRFLLLGEAAAPRLVPEFGKVHLKYAFYAVVIVVAMLVISLAFWLVGSAVFPNAVEVSGIASLICVLFVGFRLSLVLPAAAVGVKGFGLARAWRASKGQVIRLLSASLLVMLSGLVLAVIFSWLFGQQHSGFYQSRGLGSVLMMSLFMSFSGFVALALHATVTAHAFRRLTGWQR